MRVAYIIPKTNAELNQVVSILHSSGYDYVFKYNGAVGRRITVWFNIRCALLNTGEAFNHPEIRPNELYAIIHKVN